MKLRMLSLSFFVLTAQMNAASMDVQAGPSLLKTGAKVTASVILILPFIETARCGYFFLCNKNPEYSMKVDREFYEGAQKRLENELRFITQHVNEEHDERQGHRKIGNGNCLNSGWTRCPGVEKEQVGSSQQTLSNEFSDLQGKWLRNNSEKGRAAQAIDNYFHNNINQFAVASVVSSALLYGMWRR